jgi:hypothetical protein
MEKALICPLYPDGRHNQGLIAFEKISGQQMWRDLFTRATHRRTIFSTTTNGQPAQAMIRMERPFFSRQDS